MTQPDRSEQEKKPSLQPRTLQADEIIDFIQDRVEFQEAGIAQTMLTQRKRMVELFAGNVGLILVKPKNITATIPQLENVMIGSVKQDPKELALVFGKDVPVAFDGKTAINNKIASYFKSLNRSEDEFVFTVDGRILTLDGIQRNSLFVASLSHATNLTREAILDIAQSVFKLREQPAPLAISEMEEELAEEELVAEVEEELEGEVIHESAEQQVKKGEIALRLQAAIDTEAMDLRDDQVEIMERIIGGLKVGMPRMGVFAATAVGKTRAMREMVQFSGLQTLVVVPTQLLVGQTIAEFEKAGIAVGGYYTHAHDRFSDEHGVTQHQVIVTTYDAFRDASFPIKPEETQAVLYDEGHAIVGRKTFEKMLTFGQAIQIAWTGSPDLSETRSIRKLFPPVFEKGPSEYAKRGIIAGIHAWVVKTQLDLSQITLGKDGDYSEAKLSAALLQTDIGKVAAELYTQKFYDVNTRTGLSGIAFCAGIKHAELVAQDFLDRGISAAYVSGETPPEERDEIFAQFERGEILVLCNADLLMQGFDMPRTKVIFGLRPTRSIRVLLQRSGRAFRLWQNMEATIIDFMPSKFNPYMPPKSFAQVLGASTITTTEFYPISAAIGTKRRSQRLTPTGKQILSGGSVLFSTPEEVVVISSEYDPIQTPQKKESTSIWALGQKHHVSHQLLLELVRRYQNEYLGEDVFVPKGNGRGDLTARVVAYIEAYLVKDIVLDENDRSAFNLNEMAHELGVNFHTVVDHMKKLYPDGYRGFKLEGRRRGISTRGTFYPLSVLEALRQDIGVKKVFDANDTSVANVYDLARLYKTTSRTVVRILCEIYGDDYKETAAIRGRRNNQRAPSFFFKTQEFDEYLEIHYPGIYKRKSEKR